jgi:tetratricopeptide (TPR) repeat protein
MPSGPWQRKLISANGYKSQRSNSRVEMRRHPVQSFPVSAPDAPRPLFLPAVAAGLLVVAALFALLAASRPYSWAHPAAAEPYNQMVEGFRAGHPWLPQAAPPALAAAPNPYDFATYRPYLAPPWNLTDLTYYRGHLYAYFGVTPALLVFWPWRLLTGGPVHQAYAVLLFCVVGYAAALGLALAAWRRYFPAVGPWAGPVLAVLLGSVTTLPVFIVRPGLYEVAISCGFALVMLCLVGLWNAWHRATGQAAWLAAASLAYGLAVGARPTLLFGAAVLLLPVVGAWARARRGEPAAPWGRLALAAILPILAVGIGLAAYNQVRFGSPLQFGHEYQLSGNDVTGRSSFGLPFLWDNVRLYFLAPPRWHAGFPFVWEPVLPRLSPLHLPVEFFLGTLVAFPVLLAAVLAPRARPARPALAALLILFAGTAIPICFYAGATSRYLLDFLPALVLLAALGVLAAAAAARPLRLVVGAALGYSVVVAWLLAVSLSRFYQGAEEGMALLSAGRTEEAAALYGRACLINPDFKGTAELGLGSALVGAGRTDQGLALLRAAAADDPALEAAHFDLGEALLRLGQFNAAAESLRRAIALDRFDAEAEADLGVALFRQGRLAEAIEHERAAVRIQPGLAQARQNLQGMEALAAPAAR